MGSAAPVAGPEGFDRTARSVGHQDGRPGGETDVDVGRGAGGEVAAPDGGGGRHGDGVVIEPGQSAGFVVEVFPVGFGIGDEVVPSEEGPVASRYCTIV